MVHGRSFRLSSGSAEVGGVAQIVRARIPWLLIGLAGGFLAGGVASLFEAPLKDNITLAFFLPLVVYMADAVVTQTETILVRALAYGKVSLRTQLLREGAVGLLIGGIVGLSAGAGLGRDEISRLHARNHARLDRHDRDVRRQPVADWIEPSRHRSGAGERPDGHRGPRYSQCGGVSGNRHAHPLR